MIDLLKNVLQYFHPIALLVLHTPWLLVYIDERNVGIYRSLYSCRHNWRLYSLMLCFWWIISFIHGFILVEATSNSIWNLFKFERFSRCGKNSKANEFFSGYVRFDLPPTSPLSPLHRPVVGKLALLFRYSTNTGTAPVRKFLHGKTKSSKI